MCICADACCVPHSSMTAQSPGELRAAPLGAPPAFASTACAPGCGPGGVRSSADLAACDSFAGCRAGVLLALLRPFLAGLPAACFAPFGAQGLAQWFAIHRPVLGHLQVQQVTERHCTSVDHPTANEAKRRPSPHLQLSLGRGALGAARLGRVRVVSLAVVRWHQLLVAGGAALVGAAAQKLHTSIVHA